jgi:hypothetical protein
MSQILRKDCIRRSDMPHCMQSTLRPLIEVTTSGLTHSWGTSFSSQPKHHRWPLKPYSYFISQTFMTIAHYVVPWRDLVIRSVEEVKDEKQEGREGGKAGKQFELGLNFGEFEFDFRNDCRLASNDSDSCDNQMQNSGAVIVRIFGKEANKPPKLEMRLTFDQLSGKANLPGMTASLKDFMTAQDPAILEKTNNEWICVPYRGMPHIAVVYASNFIMFLVFCSLFFLPFVVVVAFLIAVRRRWLRWKQTSK